MIKVIAGYIVCGFIACELAWFLSCRPFWGYWALPVPNGIIYCPPPPYSRSLKVHDVDCGCACFYSAMCYVSALLDYAGHVQYLLRFNDVGGWNSVTVEG